MSKACFCKLVTKRGLLQSQPLKWFFGNEIPCIEHFSSDKFQGTIFNFKARKHRWAIQQTSKFPFPDRGII